MSLPFQLAPVTLICGHYGVGKTNFALNLALDAASDGCDVTLIDLDIVNPYFRSSEYRSVLEEGGVHLIAPVFAEKGTSLDVPSLTGAIIPALNRAYFANREDADSKVRVIVDVGGDDAGATALARYEASIKGGPFEVLYVVNKYRNLTQEASEALEVLDEIEAKAKLRVTGIVSNSHLQSDTDVEVVRSGLDFARAVADARDLPVVCVTVPKTLLQQEKGFLEVDVSEKVRYPIQIVVKKPWEL